MNAVGADPVDDALLDKLQRWVLECFLRAYNPRDSLVADTTREGAPASIAVIGFLNCGWEGYNEAILLYLPGLGSPTPALADESFTAWTMTYQWENLVGYDFLYVGPLFIHQFSRAWIDFRGIRDAFMREKDCDYCENKPARHLCAAPICDAQPVQLVRTTLTNEESRTCPKPCATPGTPLPLYKKHRSLISWCKSRSPRLLTPPGQQWGRSTSGPSSSLICTWGPKAAGHGI